MYMNLNCGKCNTELPTKLAFDLHSHFCNSKKKTAKDIAMFNCIMFLTSKCEALDKKIAKIHSSTTRFRKKHIDEYLQNIPPPKLEFNDWSSSIEFTENDFQTVIDDNLEEGLKSVLSPLLSDMPIRAFTQKSGTFYVYDNNEWRIIPSEELSKFVRTIAHKAKRNYSKWYKDNIDKINSSDKMRDKSMALMRTLLAKDSTVSAIKKWMFDKIAVSLNNVDFG